MFAPLCQTVAQLAVGGVFNGNQLKIKEMKTYLNIDEIADFHNEIWYYKWTSGQPYEVLAVSDNGFQTIGFIDDLNELKKINLPVYYKCPYN